MPLTPPKHQCSIALWRGYVFAEFYVRRRERDEALLSSGTFRRWRFPWEERPPLEKDAAALAALDELETELIARGWERMRRAPGSQWYERRFRRAEAPDPTASLGPIRKDGAPRLTAVSAVTERATG